MPAELCWSQPASEGAGSRRRVWKILTQYGVWSQEIKLVEKEEGEKERKKSIRLKMFLLHFTQHFKLHRIFQPLLLSALEKKMKIFHVTPKSRQITAFSVSIQIITIYFSSFSGALSYQPLSYCIFKRITWSSILVQQSKPRQCPFNKNPPLTQDLFCSIPMIQLKGK